MNSKINRWLLLNLGNPEACCTIHRGDQTVPDGLVTRLPALIGAYLAALNELFEPRTSLEKHYSIYKLLTMLCKRPIEF